jgi:hypothetical protein
MLRSGLNVVYAARSNEFESMDVICPDTTIFIEQKKSSSRNNTAKKITNS